MQARGSDAHRGHHGARGDGLRRRGAPASRTCAASPNAARAHARWQRRARDSRRLSRIQSARRECGARGGSAGALLHHAQSLGVASGSIEGDAPHHHARRGHPPVRGALSTRARNCGDVRRQSAARWRSRSALARAGAREARAAARMRACSRSFRAAVAASSRSISRHSRDTAHRARAPHAAPARDRERGAGNAHRRERAHPFSTWRATRTPCGAPPMQRS